MKIILCLSVVMTFHIYKTLEECHLLQTIQSVAQYGCNSIQDFEKQGNSSIFDISIFNDQSRPAISASNFQSTPNLKRIVIKESISQINPGTFQHLKHLYALVINHNVYRHIFKGIFSNVTVEYLDLSYNIINYIEPGAFLNSTNIKKLYLRNNRLTKISKGIFSNLPLEILGLSKNRISLIEKDAFVNMKELKRLQLDGNLLSEFQPKILMNYAHKLEILWLHNNSFTKIDRDTVKGLDNLRLLNLQDNKLFRILPYTFENVLKLEVLVLSNNSLDNLDADAFPPQGMPNLIKLYLDDNRLSYLTTNLLGRWINMKGVRIGGNPWQCPCLDIMLIWLEDHNVQQRCDQDYYNGKRPICVVVDAHPNICVYSSDPSDYYRYVDINRKLPKSPLCVL